MNSLITKIALVALTSLMVGGGYLHLSSQLEEARNEAERMKQEQVGLSDSLRQLKEETVQLRDSIKATRRTYEKKDRANVDSLRRIAEQVDKGDESTQASEGRVNPSSGTIEDTSEAVSSEASVYTHRIDGEDGLVRFSGTLRVRSPGDFVTYNITANPLARDFSIAHFEDGDGLTRTRIQITGATLTEFQSYRHIEATDDGGPVGLQIELGLLAEKNLNGEAAALPYLRARLDRKILGPVYGFVGGAAKGYPPSRFQVSSGVSVSL